MCVPSKETRGEVTAVSTTTDNPLEAYLAFCLELRGMSRRRG